MKAALLLPLLLAGCAVDSAPAPKPNHQLKLLSVSCSPNYGRPKAVIAVQNIGQTTIAWPEVLVGFGGAVNKGFLDPMPLQPGSIGTATVYSPAEGDSPKCSLLSVQDGEGVPASIAR